LVLWNLGLASDVWGISVLRGLEVRGEVTFWGKGRFIRL
jgi:hypothetical protein